MLVDHFHVFLFGFCPMTNRYGICLLYPISTKAELASVNPSQLINSKYVIYIAGIQGSLVPMQLP